MADDKKNIPEAAPPAEAPAPAVENAVVPEQPDPEVPKAEKEQAQPPDPIKANHAPAHSGKVVDFAAARNEVAKEEKKRSSRSRPRKRRRLLSRAEAFRPRRVRLLPISPSRPNLGTKSPKASPPRRSLPWIRADSYKEQGN